MASSLCLALLAAQSVVNEMPRGAAFGSCTTWRATTGARADRVRAAARTSPIAAALEPSRRAPTLAHRLNRSTKWLVAAWQLCALAARRDVVAPFVVLGMVCSAFWCSALKRLLNGARPASSAASDGGMPSAHALVSAFAASAWACECGSALSAAGLGAFAVGIGGLRVCCGDHSLPQVAVGLALGSASALGWMRAGAASGLFALDSAAWPVVAVRGACALGMALFAARKAAKFVYAR